MGLPIDFFLAADGSLVQVPWKSHTERAEVLLPPDPLVGGETYAINDERLAHRRASSGERYLGTAVVTEGEQVVIHRRGSEPFPWIVVEK